MATKIYLRTGSATVVTGLLSLEMISVCSVFNTVTRFFALSIATSWNGFNCSYTSLFFSYCSNLPFFFNNFIAASLFSTNVLWLLKCRRNQTSKDGFEKAICIITVKYAPDYIALIRIIWTIPDGCPCLLYQLICWFILRWDRNDINISFSAAELFEIPNFCFWAPTYQVHYRLSLSSSRSFTPNLLDFSHLKYHLR